jgi:hypothetical protein
VLWRGAAPIEGAANMISLLRSLNKRVVFVVSWSCGCDELRGLRRLMIVGSLCIDQQRHQQPCYLREEARYVA